jgi:hypothetical protein
MYKAKAGADRIKSMQPSGVVSESRWVIAQQALSDGSATGRYVRLSNGDYSLGTRGELSKS